MPEPHTADNGAASECRGACILGRFYPHEPGCPNDQGETVSIGSPRPIPPVKP